MNWRFLRCGAQNYKAEKKIFLTAFFSSSQKAATLTYSLSFRKNRGVAHA